MPILPVLNGLARQPYLRPDGSLTTVAGYDPDTGMFRVFDAREFSIPDNPTAAQAAALGHHERSGTVRSLYPILPRETQSVGRLYRRFVLRR